MTDLASRSAEGSIDGNGWSAGVVVKHQMGDWLVSGALDGGRTAFDANRHLQFGEVNRHASGQFDVVHYGLHSRIARQIPFQSWYLKPYLDLHATHLQSGAYTEQGADDLNLRVSGSSENVFVAAPMLEAGGRFDFGAASTLRLYGALGGAFYSQGSVGSDMQFVGGDAAQRKFQVQADLPDERLKATAGVDLKANDHLNVRLEYGGEFADHYSSNQESLKVSYSF